jgi:hypothetical protein
MSAQDAEHEQMCNLFDKALETGPAKTAIDRLVYCCVLNRLTNGDTELACSVFADPGTTKAALTELEALNDTERAEIAAFVCPTFNAALSLAVGYMHRACRQLGYDPAGLRPEHIALLASVFLGPDFTHLADKLADSQPGTPPDTSL